MERTPRATPRRPADSYIVLWDLKLGEGGLAEVYLGVDTSCCNRAVAVKLVREELRDNIDVAGRFLREAAIGMDLTHPHVVATRACTEIAGRRALVLDLVGPALRDVRESVVGHWDAIRCVARDVARALAYLEREGVVHRDLSLGNVLVDPRGRVRVSDFGLATRYDGMPTPRAMGGTWAYICPERLEGERGTIASDAFSLGVLLYELATGSVPFGGSQEEVTAAHSLGVPRVPRTLPRDVREVIGGLLQLDPAQRLHAEEVEETLRAEKESARELLGASPRMWLRARCPGVEHPAERIRLFGGEVVGPVRETRRRGCAVPLAVDGVDEEYRRRLWVRGLVATALPAVAAAAGAWVVLEVRGDETAGQVAMSAVGSAERAPAPAEGVTVRLPETGEALSLGRPVGAALGSKVEELTVRSLLVTDGHKGQEEARAGVDLLADALRRRERPYTFPGGTLFLSPGVWGDNHVAYRFELVGHELARHVKAVDVSGAPVEVDLSLDDRGGVLTVKGVAAGETFQCILGDVDGHFAILDGIEVPTRK